MLEIFAYPLLRTRRRHNMLFQLDGAPPHWGLHVRAFLNKFLERWIGRGGPAAWPPRSPDINSLDFFLWGYVKIEVFKSLQHLKGRITQANPSLCTSHSPHARQNLERSVETFKNAHRHS